MNDFYTFLLLLPFIVLFLVLAVISYFQESPTTIYCPETRKPIYKYFGDLDNLQADQFFPIRGAKEIKDSDPVCSVTCGSGAPINGYCYWFWKNGLKMPRMAYPAVTLLAKRS